MKEVFQKFIDNSVARLKEDQRICGLAVGGSWPRDEIDEFSDLDLVVVTENDDFSAVFESRIPIAESLGEHISSFTGEHVGEPALLICMFSDPLIHVDLKFTALSEFHKRHFDPHVAWERSDKLSSILKSTNAKPPSFDPQWVEDRIWTWVHCYATRVGRGELFEAIGFMDYMRETVLGPMRKSQQGVIQFGLRRMEQYDPEFSSKLEKTIASYSRQSCLEAMDAFVELYRDLRSNLRDGEIQIRSGAESAAIGYLQIISSS